ncbi:hypothetical protein LJB90_02240 [Eubacteriales bacterium OttesenSCG-928-G02]|nr:hypothetical protein [Eubacteriales bacterium OttesenSCG-928-G02]
MSFFNENEDMFVPKLPDRFFELDREILSAGREVKKRLGEDGYLLDSYDDPFKQVEYAYSQIEVDDFDYQTEKLLTALQDLPPEFNGDFMLKVLKWIEVDHDGTATFVFINDKRFREELIPNAKP